jgi:rubrerythrin
MRPFEHAPDGFVAFHGVGAEVAGAFRCSACGYGVAVFRTLPRCPMCGGETWEEETVHGVARTVAEP